MSYEGLTSLPAGSAGNANEKSGPKGLPKSAFGSATTPAVNIIQKRASYVIINGQSATAYAFLYETTCSIGGTTAETHTQGLELQAISNSPIRLDIQPVSWNGGGATAGEITFVYTGR